MTGFRLSAIHQLIEEVNITVLRCNAGELAAIAGVEWQAKGVDAGQGNVDVIELAMQMARKYSVANKQIQGLKRKELIV